MLQVKTNEGIQAGESPNLESRDFFNEVSKMIASNFDLVGSINRTMNNIEIQAAHVRQLFGGTATLSETFIKTIQQATPAVIEMGGKLSDVNDIQLGILRATSTQTNLNSAAYSQLFSEMSLVSDGTVSTAKMMEDMTRKFIDSGYALENIGVEMEGIINSAREIGVSTSAVYNQISANIGKLNSFGFENGVQGMAKMAADAALLRIDMGKTLNLADKLFDPEKAIQMANTFQRLGVSVSSLLDPNKLQDMARHDPAKLQSELGEALKAYTIFDEEARKMKLTEFGMGVVRELSTEIGMSTEELSKFATNVGDLDRKMGEITFNKEFFGDKETQKMIAGLSQLGGKGTKFDNQYYVTFDDGTQKLVKELKEIDIKRIEEAFKPKSAIDLQKQANGFLLNIYNEINKFNDVSGRILYGSSSVRKDMRDVLTNVKNQGIKRLDYVAGTKTTTTKSGGMLVEYKNAQQAVEELTKSSLYKGFIGIGKAESWTDIIKGANDIKSSFSDLENRIIKGFIPNWYNIMDIVKSLGDDLLNNIQKKPTKTIQSETTTPSGASPRPVGASPTQNNKQTETPIGASSRPIMSTAALISPINTLIKSNSKMEVGGTINVKVDQLQSDFDKSMARALDRADIQNKIMTVIKQNELANNNSIGNGKVSNMPSTAMS